MSPLDPPAAQPHFELDPDELLQRLPDLTVHLQSDGSTRIVTEGRALLYGPHALRVLETFSRPVTFKDALQSSDPRFWAYRTGWI